jgi:hypothetical protein
VTSRAAAVLTVAAFLLVGSGCTDSNAPDPTSEAFTGPLSTDLIVASSSKNCPNNRVGIGDTLRISGFDYMPDSVVDLRWTVVGPGDTGTWDSVTANSDGDFTAHVKITRDVASPGDELVINSRGSSESGILVLQAKVGVGGC